MMLRKRTKQRQHCWHERGRSENTSETRYPVQCCRCGTHSVKVLRTVQEHMSGHGPYAVVPRTRTTIELDSPCLGPVLT